MMDRSPHGLSKRLKKKLKKKNVVRVGPPLTKLLDPRMHDLECILRV